MASPTRAALTCVAHLAAGSLRLGAHALRELDLPSSLGYQALGSQHHHDHEQEAEDPERQLGEVEVEPELVRHVVEHVGDQAVVDERQRDRAQTTPQIEPSPPRMTMARMKIENENCELVGVDRVEVRAEEPPAMPPNAAPVA